jgi:small subunit ribosomal protein S5
MVKEENTQKNARPRGRRKGGFNSRGPSKQRRETFEKETWNPKTSLGKQVKNGDITDIEIILDNSERILEDGIVDVLMPNLTTDLLMVGQSKGKFGGGQKRVFKQTQKKTQEGNKPKFATYAVVGNEDGIVGIGFGKSKETVPAREKAIRNAKLGIIKIRRGCGDWRCGCGEPHTIPFSVKGKCGSVVVELYPAPKGAGLKVEKECAKILKLAGIKDIWSKTKGQTKTKINLFKACLEALNELMRMKMSDARTQELNIVEGAETKSKVEVT